MAETNRLLTEKDIEKYLCVVDKYAAARELAKQHKVKPCDVFAELKERGIIGKCEIRFKEEDDVLLLQMFEDGKKWSEIADALGNYYTRQQCMSRLNYLKGKKTDVTEDSCGKTSSVTAGDVPPSPERKDCVDEPVTATDEGRKKIDECSRSEQRRSEEKDRMLRIEYWIDNVCAKYCRFGIERITSGCYLSEDLIDIICGSCPIAALAEKAGDLL